MLTAIPVVLADQTDAGDVVLIAIAAMIAMAQVILWIAAAVSIVRSGRYTGGGKFLWFVVIIAFPFLGCLGWFLFGRSAQLVRPETSAPLRT